MIWWKTFMVCQSHDSHSFSSKCIFVKIYQVLSNHACHRARVRHRSQLIHHFYWEKIYRNATHMWEKTEKCVLWKRTEKRWLQCFIIFTTIFYIFAKIHLFAFSYVKQSSIFQNVNNLCFYFQTRLGCRSWKIYRANERSYLYGRGRELSRRPPRMALFGSQFTLAK